MSTQSGPLGVWCPQCDRDQRPCRLVRKQGGTRQEGMVVACPQCHRQYNYAQLMRAVPPPRMDPLPNQEKQPPGTSTISVWIYPEVLSALQSKFPQNLQTTLCSLLTAVADPDTVVIEGEYARQMAELGIKRGREVLSLAREVKDLREQVEAMKLERQTLQQFFGALGMAMPGMAQAAAPGSQFPSQQPLLGPDGQPLRPPHQQFAYLDESGGEMVETGAAAGQPAPQFTFGQGAAPTASAVPGFVVGNLRGR